MTRKKLIYYKATVVLVGYLLISNVLFISYAIKKNPIVSFGTPMIFGAISTLVFLYLFSHEDLFKFAKVIEKKEEKKEKRLLKTFAHAGRVSTAVLIGTVGGPIFSALTIRLLLPKAKYRYLLGALISIPSTLFSVGLAKGAIRFIF